MRESGSIPHPQPIRTADHSRKTAHALSSRLTNSGKTPMLFNPEHQANQSEPHHVPPLTECRKLSCFSLSPALDLYIMIYYVDYPKAQAVRF